MYLIEILHQTTTNRTVVLRLITLYLIEILHQTTTEQRRGCGPGVVSYRNSTSNHNASHSALFSKSLYLIEILHQTTTTDIDKMKEGSCILSKFYIKPQRLIRLLFWELCCILSKFYIKPQRSRVTGYRHVVVSYRNSTSNHNYSAAVVSDGVLYLIEILHQTTTLGLILIDKVLLTGCLPL